MKKTWTSDDGTESYVGEFDGEKKHGEGVYTWIDMGEVSGQFENDELPNHGKFVQYGSYEYVGQMKNRDGVFNGKGKLISSNPKYTYEGDFLNGNFHGYGIYIQEDGTRYEGEFKNGLRHGKGTTANAIFFRSGEDKGEEFIMDGGPLIGEYNEDYPVGNFVWEMKSGRKYFGELNKDGLFHGKGTLTHPDGKIEKGIWDSAKLIKEE